MKISNESQQGQDNTRVYKPQYYEPIKAKPRQHTLIDAGGEPSKDTRTSTERNKDYWHPVKGAKDRFKASMHNKTNPLVGIENTILPSMAGAGLVTTPATIILGALGGEAMNGMTGGWGEWLEDKTGIPSEIGNYTNPGALYGGTKGYRIDSNKLASKFIKGDADLGWTPLNKNHWIFNKEARTPTNMAMATINRVMPFMSNIEKTPARIAAYNVGKRTKGNASVSIKDIKNNESTYTGASTPEGNNGDRNLLGMYLFKDDPIISRSPWFKKVTESFKPANGKGFSYDQRYSELYPGIENRRYKMSSVVKDTHPLKFKSVKELSEYAGDIGKVQGKEGDMVVDMGSGFQTFRQPGTNYVGPIDDVGGHLVKVGYNNRGKLTQISQDMWKFNPRDYTRRWSGSTPAETIQATKQAALMDKVGTPFILQQENPIHIGTKRIWEDIQKVPEIVRRRRMPSIQQGLLVMREGGSLTSDGRTFKFKESALLRNAKALNNRRDMRKKFVKSDRPTYTNNRVKKGQEGLQFVRYEALEAPEVDMPEYKVPKNLFSSYHIPVSTPMTYEPEPKVEEVPIKEEKQTQPIQTKTRFSNNKDFINRMKSAFSNALTKRGLDTKYTDYLVAQSALESGWGKHQSGKNNFGGIKGKGTTRKTREVINGKDVYINDSFRDFDSIEDYADYHVGLLNNNRYKAFSGDFIDRVVKGGYATDPRYRDSLNKMYNQITRV